MHPKVYSHVTHESLHSAVDKGNVIAVKTLLSRGLCVDAQDSSARTLLHTASSNGDETMVKLLLKFNAKVDIEDYQGFTPFDVALEEWDLNIFKLLLNSCGHEKRAKYVNIRNPISNALPLHLAALYGDLQLVKYIIKNGGEVEDEKDNYFELFTPLHYAIVGGNPKCVRELLNHIDDINVAKYKNLIHIVAEGNWRISDDHYFKKRAHMSFRYPERIPYNIPIGKLNKDIKELQYVEILDILLNAGIKFNLNDIAPMEYAIIFKNFLVAERLNEHCIKCEVNYLSSRARDLVNSAIRYHAPVNLINKLLNAGAPVSWKDSLGYLPMHNMALSEYYNVLSLLIRAGADINERSDDGDTIIHMHESKNVLCLYTLLMYGLNIHACNDFGETGLHELCCHYFEEDCEYVGILLDWFLDFNIVNENGETPLQNALNSKFSNKHVQCIIKAMVKVESSQTSSVKISESNMDTIISNEYLKFYQACVIELENLKMTKVYGHLSFFELIDKPLEKLKAYTRNSELMEVLNSRVCDSFPVYGELIESRMCVAKKLQNLHEQSLKTLYQLINPIQLPDIAAHKILSFLNVDELEKLSLM